MDFEQLYHAERREKEKERREKEKEKREKEKEKRGRLEAEANANREREGRLKAEKIAKGARGTTIPELLTLYHAKSLSMRVANNGLAGGVVSKPVGRKYPLEIAPWEDFASEQRKIWNFIRASPTYSNRYFDPSNVIEAIRLREIRSETDLVIADDRIVLSPVQDILNVLCEDKELKDALELSDKVVNAEFRRNTQLAHVIPSPFNPVTPTNHPKDIGGQADAFFYLDAELKASIEYKLPIKFPIDDIVLGLKGKISTVKDVINNEANSPEAAAQRQATIVITQLYSYLVKSRICYGYVSTGDIIIFLRISDNPAHVQYHVWNRLAFDFNDPAYKHNTAIAEVVAFSILAMRAGQTSQKWYDDSKRLKTWPQEYDSFSDDSPKTNTEASPDRSPGYKGRADPSIRSPIKTRQKTQEKDNAESGSPSVGRGTSGCRPQDLGVTKEDQDPNNGGSKETPVRRHLDYRTSTDGRAGNQRRGDGGQNTRGGTGDHRKRVREREYCSPSCLLGLSQGGHLDLDCPNIADHGKSHLTQRRFLCLVREQLARDRGHITDCEPLWINGSRGEMFKITLTSHGYTVIAKGVQIHNVPHIKNEAKIYHHLRSLQGIHIPVCLGAINLILPYYHKGGIFVRFLLQSYAGMSVGHTINEKNKDDILSKLTHALTTIHQLRVLHGDPDPVNFLIDEKSGVLQVIDFERSQICGEKEKEVASGRKKKLRRGARLAKANETVAVPSPSSPSRNSMVEQPAGQNREGVKMTGEEFIFKEERFTAYYQTLMRMR